MDLPSSPSVLIHLPSRSWSTSSASRRLPLHSNIMANNLPVTLIMLVVSWIIYCAYCLALNYRIARKVGVALIVILISLDNVVWIIIEKYFIPLFKRLPFENGIFTRVNRHDWQANDYDKAHLNLDDAFITVTPEKNWLYVCNAETLTEILRRGSNFPRALEIVGEIVFARLQNSTRTVIRANKATPEMLNVFGPSVSTVSKPR